MMIFKFMLVIQSLCFEESRIRLLLVTCLLLLTALTKKCCAQTGIAKPTGPLATGLLAN